jgi:hypothetical protein
MQIDEWATRRRFGQELEANHGNAQEHIRYLLVELVIIATAVSIEATVNNDTK